MRVALTGATGYTGGRLLQALVARGDSVRALTRSAQPLNERVDWVTGDLSDDTSLQALVSGVDGVLHVAAVYRTAGHPDSYYREVNVEGTRRLLEAAAKQGVRRFVHTSTVGVHGHVEHAPADEASPLRPGDIYQETKVEGEAVAWTFHRDRGVPVAVVRPGAIYGPGETRLLKLFRAIARGRYAIVGSGRTFYHPVYIDDLVDGYLRALDRPEAAGEPFIIAGPDYLTQGQMADVIARATGGRVLPFRIPAWPLQAAGAVVEAFCVPFGIDPPLHRRRVDFWTKSRAFTTQKARRLLGYEPRVGFAEGAARTVAAYRAAGWL